MLPQLAGPFYKKYSVGRLLRLPTSVNNGFQVLFHSPPGVLFTFPSQYFSTIGHQGVFRLGGWSPRLPTGFLVSRGTLDTAACHSGFAYGAFTLFGRLSQNRSTTSDNHVRSPQPRMQASGLACCNFARRYFRNRFFFLFLPLLRCFSSRRFPLHDYVFTMQ